MRGNLFWLPLFNKIFLDKNSKVFFLKFTLNKDTI